MTSFAASIFHYGLDLWKCTTPQTVLSSTGALGGGLSERVAVAWSGWDARVDMVCTFLAGWRKDSPHQRPADTRRLLHKKDCLTRPAQRVHQMHAAMVPA